MFLSKYYSIIICILLIVFNLAISLNAAPIPDQVTVSVTKKLVTDPVFLKYKLVHSKETHNVKTRLKEKRQLGAALSAAIKPAISAGVRAATRAATVAGQAAARAAIVAGRTAAAISSKVAQSSAIQAAKATAIEAAKSAGRAAIQQAKELVPLAATAGAGMIVNKLTGSPESAKEQQAPSEPAPNDAAATTSNDAPVNTTTNENNTTTTNTTTTEKAYVPSELVEDVTRNSNK